MAGPSPGLPGYQEGGCLNYGTRTLPRVIVWLAMSMRAECTPSSLLLHRPVETAAVGRAGVGEGKRAIGR
jgi:hypothetical protein